MKYAGAGESNKLDKKTGSYCIPFLMDCVCINFRLSVNNEINYTMIDEKLFFIPGTEFKNIFKGNNFFKINILS